MTDEKMDERRRHKNVSFALDENVSTHLIDMLRQDECHPSTLRFHPLLSKHRTTSNSSYTIYPNLS
jgi:hypothetical protein